MCVVEGCLQLGNNSPGSEPPTTHQTSDLLPMGVKLPHMGGKVLPLRAQMPTVGMSVSPGQLPQSVDGTGKLPQVAIALDAVAVVDDVRRTQDLIELVDDVAVSVAVGVAADVAAAVAAAVAATYTRSVAGLEMWPSCPAARASVAGVS